MVWGAPLPPGPYGEYEGPGSGWPNSGWWCRLEDWRRDHMSESDKALYGTRSYWYCVHAKFVSDGKDTIREGDQTILLPPIQPHEPPTWFKYESGHKSPAAMISLPSRVLAVSEPLMGIIEHLEPGVHRFFPIEVKNRSGSVYAVPYYIMVIGQVRDSFSPADSAEHLAQESNGTTWYYCGNFKDSVTGVALDHAKHDGLHLWVEKVFGDQLVCMSDDLVARVKAVGLKMPRHWRMREV